MPTLRSCLLQPSSSSLPGTPEVSWAGNARRATRLIGTGVVDPKTGEWLGDWALEVNGDPSLERAEGLGANAV